MQYPGLLLEPCPAVDMHVVHSNKGVVAFLDQDGLDWGVDYRGGEGGNAGRTPSGQHAKPAEEAQPCQLQLHQDAILM